MLQKSGRKSVIVNVQGVCKNTNHLVSSNVDKAKFRGLYISSIENGISLKKETLIEKTIALLINYEVEVFEMVETL